MTSDYMSFFMFAPKAVFELSLEGENQRFAGILNTCFSFEICVNQIFQMHSFTFSCIFHHSFFNTVLDKESTQCI